jgi:hypothetical protein
MEVNYIARENKFLSVTGVFQGFEVHTEEVQSLYMGICDRSRISFRGLDRSGN